VYNLFELFDLARLRHKNGSVHIGARFIPGRIHDDRKGNNTVFLITLCAPA